MLALLVISLLLAGLVYTYAKWARILLLAKNFEGVPGTLPLLGDSLLFLGKEPEEYVHTILNMTRQCKENVKFWLGPEMYLLLMSLKDIEAVMSSMKHIEKSNDYDMMRPWLREGLLTSMGKKWFQRRKIITPAFHFKILEQFVEVFDAQSNVTIDILRNHEHGREIELYPIVTLSALDVICESAMGVSVNAQRDSDSEYVRAVKTISMVLHKRMFDILYRFNFLFRLTPLAREQDKALSVLHKFSRKVITSRREELLRSQEKTPQIEENQNDIGVKRKMAFLDILLQSEIDGKPLSDLDIQEEVDTFMFEGHDTTTSAITFCLYNLARHPEAQQKCFDEILTIFGADKEKPATYDDLCNLHYMELCIKETLRMFPSVPLIGRKIREECTINGKIIPAGTNIAISPLALGRDESIFPNADQFIPERFDVVTSAEKLNPYAFIPFSAGPRNCIGQKFAMLEAKSIVSKVLRHFELEFIDSGELLLIAELILKSKNSLKFRLKPRVY